MLSGETSVGRYPLATVRAMQKIISEVEMENEIYYRETAPQKNSASFLSDSISYNACVMARQVEATAIAAMTHSGMTAFKISAHRPKSHIFIFTDNKPMLKILNLLWGVRGFYYDKYESTDTTIKDVRTFLVENNMVQSGDFMIHVASTPLKERATSNTIKLTRID
jgi:pyruvate kinase